jgi:hypothetical protein
MSFRRFHVARAMKTISIGRMDKLGGNAAQAASGDGRAGTARKSKGVIVSILSFLY